MPAPIESKKRCRKMPSFQNSNDQRWPEDVGILALEIYFPSQYVSQAELEQFDGVSEGKYLIGLGQEKMGFCSDNEDVYSLCLTVTQRLLERNAIDPKMIGRLEVGTETLVDKSKSIKTVLMQLFEECENKDIEGVDSVNACYGGTAALLNSIAWIESSSWDGRFALVVAGDIAIYASGNARSTGGAGAVAMLIGPHAPLVVERGLRASHMEHVYDFYKPDLKSEYPIVDGKLSVQCYLSALDKCYQRYCQKYAFSMKKSFLPTRFTVNSVQSVLFHSPYCKLVQKSLARLVLNDFLNSSPEEQQSFYSELEQFRDLKLEESYFNRDVEKAFLEFSKANFKIKTAPSLLLAKQVGNMYTPSLYACLASLISCTPLSKLAGQRILMFSYGSGLASTMFSLKVSSDHIPGSSLEKLHHSLCDLQTRLNNRIHIDPFTFTEVLKLREQNHNKAPYFPQTDSSDLFPGTWFLTEIDDKYRRKYERKPLSSFVKSKAVIGSSSENKILGMPSAANDSHEAHPNLNSH